MVEANGTLEPTLDSRKSDGAVVITASRWPGLVFFLVVVLFLDHLLLSYLLGHLLLSRLLLDCLSGRLLGHLGRVLLGCLFFQLFNPCF
jgi:hypothetical protein